MRGSDSDTAEALDIQLNWHNHLIKLRPLQSSFISIVDNKWNQDSILPVRRGAHPSVHNVHPNQEQNWQN